MGAPIAYLLTWTCRGTWLPGDARGSVDAGHNRYGTPLAPSDARREASATLGLSSAPMTLTDAARGAVEQAIRDHCALRGWKLLAINVRTNHVHVVVAARIRPGDVLAQLKSWATRRLRAEGLIAGTRPWTDYGSTRYLFNDDSVARAVDYVLNQQ